MSKAENVSETSKDINDIFDDIFLAEENLIEENYQKGLELSREQDNTEGYHLGYHRGSEIGAEIGYYLAITEYYLSHFKTSSEGNDRILNELGTLQEMLASFPNTNDPETDLLSLLESIRAKFKKISSNLKLKPTNTSNSKLAF